MDGIKEGELAFRSMDYPFTIPGYEHVPLVVRAGIFSGPKILKQGVPLETLGKRKDLRFRLVFADGAELPLQLKMDAGNFVPRSVIYQNQMIEVAPPMPWYAWGLICLPGALIFIGGALGGICGAMGAAVNVEIFRRKSSAAVKVLLSVLATICTAAVWLICAVAFTMVLHHH